MNNSNMPKWAFKQYTISIIYGSKTATARSSLRNSVLLMASIVKPLRGDAISSLLR